MESQNDNLEGHMPRSGEVDCVASAMMADAAEDEYPATNSMVVDVDAPGMLIEGEEVDGARADTYNTDLETLCHDELEAPNASGILLGSPEQDERPAKEIEVALADGVSGIVSEETIKAFVGGKKAKVGTKTKDIDNYLKLFINAHRLPHNRCCRCVHSNFFFSNHGVYLFQCALNVCSFFS